MSHRAPNLIHEVYERRKEDDQREKTIARACEPQIGDLFIKGEATAIVTGIAHMMVGWQWDRGAESKFFETPIEEWQQLVRRTIERGAEFHSAT